MNNKLSNSGFTLVELMVTVSLTLIVMLLGVPSMAHWVETNRLDSTYDSLSSSVRLAQQEAIRRSNPVMLCPADIANNKQVCLSSWQGATGWMSFIDSDRNNAFDASDELVHMGTFSDEHQLNADRALITLFPSGQAMETDFTLVGKDAQRILALSRSGRLSNES